MLTPGLIRAILTVVPLSDWPDPGQCDMTGLSFRSTVNCVLFWVAVPSCIRYQELAAPHYTNPGSAKRPQDTTGRGREAPAVRGQL